MSKSNNIAKWDIGNNLVDSGVSITSIGGSLTAKSGTFYRILDAGNETVTITHSLGKIPTNITFFAFTLTANGFGIINYGTYNSTGNLSNGFSFLFSGNQIGGTYWTNEDKCIIQGSTNENRQNGVCGNVSSTTFDITWTKVGNPSNDTCIISWNAIG